MFYSFQLAEKLGVTVAELLSSVSSYEFEMWKIFDDTKAKLEKDEMDKAKRRKK